MRVSGIVLFLAVLVIPVSLFAQQGGGGTSSAATSSINTDFGSSFGGVANVSEQSVGTFIGGGRPTVGFVGNVEIYSTGSNRSSTARTTSSTARTTTARAVTTTAQRRAATTARTTQTGANAQTIRSLTAIDFDFVMPSQRVQTATVETHLNRVTGIQDSQVALQSSPVGTTAVLTGTVDSDRGRRVAQQLLLMQPGISRVENLLEIR